MFSACKLLSCALAHNAAHTEPRKAPTAVHCAYMVTRYSVLLRRLVLGQRLQPVQEYPNNAQPARPESTEVAPSVMAPTFSGGAGLHSGLGNSNKHSNSTTMPVSESYMERQSSQAFGPIAAKRRSQSLIKMDRSGMCCAAIQTIWSA